MSDIQPYKESWAILMKSGLVHWVSKDTGEKAAEHLANQTSHSFLRIRELGCTINTAEMEGVYPPNLYEDIVRAKAGDWQCSFRKWHPRRGECQCRADWARKNREQTEAQKPQEKELPPEERERMMQEVEIGNQKAALNGSSLFRGYYRKGNPGRKMISREALESWERENGRTPNVEGLEVEEVMEQGELIDNEEHNEDDNK